MPTQTIYNFPLIIEQDEDGFFATCPKLQGCYAQGETYEEVMSNIKDVITLHIEDIRSEHQEIPTPTSMILSSIQITA